MLMRHGTGGFRLNNTWDAALLNKSSPEYIQLRNALVIEVSPSFVFP